MNYPLPLAPLGASVLDRPDRCSVAKCGRIGNFFLALAPLCQQHFQDRTGVKINTSRR